jgi:hypothetical protein
MNHRGPSPSRPQPYRSKKVGMQFEHDAPTFFLARIYAPPTRVTFHTHGLHMNLDKPNGQGLGSLCTTYRPAQLCTTLNL